MGYLDSPADDQIRSIFDVVKDYTYALDTLDTSTQLMRTQWR